MSATPARAPVPCPNCGTLVIFDLCSKDWCPTCGQRFCCSDNACLEAISADLWDAHQALLLSRLLQPAAHSQPWTEAAE